MMKNRPISILLERVVFVWKIPSFPVLFLLNTIFGLAMSFFLPFSSIFGIDEAGMSNGAFGIFMTITAIGGVLISSFIAKKSDTNLSRKKILILSAAAGILGYILYAYLRNYWALTLAGFFVLGTSSAAVPQLWAYARDVLRKNDIRQEDTPLVMNIFRMFFALAWTVGPAFGAWLLHISGFQGLFLSVAGGYVLALAAIIFLLKDIDSTGKVEQGPLEVKKFLVKPHIFGNLAAAFLLSTAFSIHMLNVPQFVTKVLDGTEMQVGIIFSVAPIFEVPMMIIVGMLATKMDVAILIRIGFTLAFVYFFLFAFVTEPWHIYPLQIISAAQVSITAGIAISYFQDFMPEAPGTATTLYMNTTQIGSTAGYLLFGFISEVISYGQLIIIYTILAAAGVLFLFLFGRQKVLDAGRNLPM
ncbi:sugar efflux transporter [Peribacillus sp. SCS-26]|uniref:sugar efflux transporter n=1 Tax=Paraperibacillus marinus TaxID=3115295 RepID=UPI0039063013